MKSQTQQTNEIIGRLETAGRKKNLVSAVKGINVFILTLFLTNIAVSLVELLGARSVNSRTALFYASAGFNLLVLIFYVGLPLLKSFGILFKAELSVLAEETGNYFPQIKDSLLNSIQLNKKTNAVYNYSEALIKAAVAAVYEKSKNLDFKEIVNYSSTKKYFQSAGAALIISAAIFAVFPDLRQASYRVLNYSKEFIEPAKFTFTVEPGDVKLTKGEDVVVKIHTVGDTPESISFFRQSVEQTDFTSNELFPDSLGNFMFRINSVKSSFRYYASRDKIQSAVYNAEVISRPIVNNFEVKVTPPRYAGLAETVQRDNGNIAALAGSSVRMKISTNKDISEARLIFSDSSKVLFNTSGKEGDAGFQIKGDAEYKILLTDIEGNLNASPIEYSVKIIPDEYPAIEMISPNSNIKLGQSNQVPLVVQISDDYGFSRLVLNYKISASLFEKPWLSYKSHELIIKKDKSQEVFYTWGLDDIVLAVNDVLSYYVEVFDNDNINGPKSGKTPLFNIVVPSLDEMFAEAEEAQVEAEKDLTQLLEETEELTEELNRIANEMKQDDRELSWEEKEKIEKAVKNFEELADKTEEVQKKMNEMQNELQENNLLSEETLKKYMELQELMDELNSDEMKAALQRLDEIMKQMNRDQTQRAFEEMQFSEEMFQKSLERTLNLLKRIQVEQKIDELVKRTENISEELKELMKETENKDLSNKSENDKLTDKQENISEKTDKLNEEMEKLKDKMSEFDDMPLEDLEKILEQMKNQQNDELSEQIKQQLQKMQQAQATQSQQQMQQNMQSLQQQLEQMRSKMQTETQMQALFEMMKTVNNLLSLSKDQETLKNSIGGVSTTSEQFKESALVQSEIQRNLDRILQQLAELSQKTFAITPEMGRALGQARNEMSQSIESIQNRSSSAAAQRQTESMKHLNEAASLMKNNMEQMMSGGQGGGMMSLMQQMQQMAQQQMSLNQLTQQLNQQGQLTMEQRAQLQRLAQEQEMIRKSLDQLNDEAKSTGQSRKLAANLERVLQEMNEVVSGMRTEKVDDDLVQAQERIMSKLLDAQRSINERDFEKERESQTGKLFNRESPPEIIFATEEGKDKLRDELIKAIREGYTKDYEDLIKKYYENLQKEKLKN